MAKNKEESVVKQVSWVGNAGIEEAARLKKTLTDAFKKASSIELDLSGVEDMDIIGVQLILAAKKQAEKEHKLFFVKENIPKKLVEFTSGFGIEINKLNFKDGGSNA